MKSKFNLFVFVLLITTGVIPAAMAHCPLCTAAAGTGVAVARYFGVDDSIVGLFLGAFIVSSALWLNVWLRKRNFHIQNALLVLVSFLLFVIPFYLSGIITPISMVKSMPEHHSFSWLGFLGIDKIMFGIILGTIMIWGSFGLSDHIKNKRGRVLFPYQGISFMVLTLVILSLVLWRVL